MVGISTRRDGWTGEECPICNGCGLVIGSDGEEHSCGACGGTGDEYDSSQDDRDKDTA